MRFKLEPSDRSNARQIKGKLSLKLHGRQLAADYWGHYKLSRQDEQLLFWGTVSMSGGSVPTRASLAFPLMPAGQERERRARALIEDALALQFNMN